MINKARLTSPVPTPAPKAGKETSRKKREKVREREKQFQLALIAAEHDRWAAIFFLVLLFFFPRPLPFAKNDFRSLIFSGYN